MDSMYSMDSTRIAWGAEKYMIEPCAYPRGSVMSAALAIWEKVIGVSIKRDTSRGP